MAHSEKQLSPRTESPVGDFFSLETVDVNEQAMIQEQISMNSEDKALREALRRSLAECSSDITSDLNSVHIGSDTGANSDTVPAVRDTASASSYVPASSDDANLIDFGSTSDDDLGVPDNLVSPGGQYQQPGSRLDLEEPINGLTSSDSNLVAARQLRSDDRDHCEEKMQSSSQSASSVQSEQHISEDSTRRSQRRPSLERAHQGRSERRPSLERAYQGRSERRPSLERAYQGRSERRPSLERAYQGRSERRSSLERAYQGRSERRPSLERAHQSRSERRPSLERASQNRSERRPSLERAFQNRSERRPSLERASQNRSERRPSLERASQNRSERRPSLERASQNRSERRPSLERAYQNRSERRPSLDRVNRDRHHRSPSPDRTFRHEHDRNPSPGDDDRYRHNRSPSPDRTDRHKPNRRFSPDGARCRHNRSPSPDRANSGAQRRPSLERLEQHGLQRRSSLELLQGAAERAQSLAEGGASSGSGQGINTLHPPAPDKYGIPLNWDRSQLPKPEERYRLVQLSPMDSDYSAVTVDFEEAGLKALSVERLQNMELLELFNNEKTHLLKHRPTDFALNERYLYHGTQAEHHRLCEEGLDFRLSFQGCFGNGTYFSDNPRKCMQYVGNGDTSGRSRPMILVCRVVLGESKVYDHGIRDASLKREPERRMSKNGQRFFDSVQGIPVDYPEFVVYRNNRSMIEYIVTFEEVSYRSPPSQFNFYRSQLPQLYKCEVVELPIPEEELDRLYMLGPDTDSDGSCDEHTREVESLRENVKRGKAKRLGIPFRLPTKEEKRYERLHWKRVCYYSCPPGSPLYDAMIIKKKEEKDARKKKKAQKKKAQGAASATAAASDTASASTSALEVSGGAAAKDQATSDEDQSQDQYDMEDEGVKMVLDSLISRFCEVTSTDDVEVAKQYIKQNSMDLDKAVDCYMTDKF